MNVQQTIARGIKEQLFYHNYLVLPGFGGFVLKATPSQFARSGGLLQPPSKTVSFNAQLKQNDGILALWLQSQLGCTANEALNHLQEFAEFCSSVLTARRRFNLDGIGFFYLDLENNICFEPLPDANFLAASFGLGAVSLQELEAPTPETVRKDPVFIDRTIRPETLPQQPAPKVRRHYRRLAIPALATLFIFSLLLLFVANNRFTGQFQASVFGSNATGSYQPFNYAALDIVPAKPARAAYVADANGIASLEIDADKSIAVSLSPLPLAVKPGFAPAAQGNYEIVLGCFAVPQNAGRMANKLANAGVAALVSGRNDKGMYIVSSGRFATKAQAVVQLDALKQKFPNAWIKKRD